MYNCELEPVGRRYWIPPSHAGINATVRHMERIATSSARAPDVLDTAADIVGSSSGQEAAERIREYLATRMVFQFDPPGVELIRTPELLIRQIGCNGVAYGDCDDVAVLGAALALSVGLRASYVLLAFSDAGPFEHVYTELETDSGPVELDTTRPAHLPPELEIRRTDHREIVMYEPRGLSGFWGDLGDGLVQAAPQVAPDVPAERKWWETGLEAVTTAAGGWVATEIGQSSDPYGPGYTGGYYVSEEPPEPVVLKAGMPPVVNALLLGGVLFAGLKYARII